MSTLSLLCPHSAFCVHIQSFVSRFSLFVSRFSLLCPDSAFCFLIQPFESVSMRAGLQASMLGLKGDSQLFNQARTLLAITRTQHPTPTLYPHTPHTYQLSLSVPDSAQIPHAPIALTHTPHTCLLYLSECLSVIVLMWCRRSRPRLIVRSER